MSQEPSQVDNATMSGSEEVGAPLDTQLTTLPNDDCRLCPGGQRPTQPDKIVTGFSWTCDELDAAIPVLYTHPELLYFSIDDIPPCKNYSSFGKLCGCPETNDDAGISTTPSAKSVVLMKEGMFGLTGAMIALALMLLFLRRRSSFG